MARRCVSSGAGLMMSIIFAISMLVGFNLFSAGVPVFLTFCGKTPLARTNALHRSKGRGFLTPRLSRTREFSEVPVALDWLQVGSGSEIIPKDNLLLHQEKHVSAPESDIAVLPVLPFTAVPLPGDKVSLRIVDAGYIQLYEDLLMSGTRRFVMTFTKSLPGGHVDYSSMLEEDRLIHALGAVVHLDDLKEVSRETNGAVKYEAHHSVIGRARVKRLLNPQALHVKDAKGQVLDYMRAEVEVMDGDETTKASTQVRSSTLRNLETLWEEHRLLAEALDEPRVQSTEYIRDLFPGASIWQLVDIWRQVTKQVHIHRARMNVYARVNEIIATAQREGKVSKDLQPPIELTQLGIPIPEDITEEVALLQDPEKIILQSDFWQPILELFSAHDAQSRADLLVDLAQKEINTVRTRTTLKRMFG